MPTYKKITGVHMHKDNKRTIAIRPGDTLTVENDALLRKLDPDMRTWQLVADVNTPPVAPARVVSDASDSKADVVLAVQNGKYETASQIQSDAPGSDSPVITPDVTRTSVSSDPMIVKAYELVRRPDRKYDVVDIDTNEVINPTPLPRADAQNLLDEIKQVQEDKLKAAQKASE